MDAVTPDPGKGTQVKKAGRRPRGLAKSRQASGDFTQYLVMHEVNIAMCLAGGILAPRPEESASRDHHLMAGRLILESTRPSMAAFTGARGDLPYGTVVVAEVLRPMEGAEKEVACLPLLQVKRLVFPSAERRDEFEARVFAYGDVPEGVVALEIDQALFEHDLPGVDAPEASRGTSDGSHPVEPHTSLEGGQGLASTVRGIDRCAGALAASLSTLPVDEAPSVLEALGGFGAHLQDGLFPSDFATSLALRVDDSPDASSYVPLLRALVQLLAEGITDDGLSAAVLLRRLDQLRCKEDIATEGSKAWERFARFAQDVVALRREPPARAFADGDGSAVPRGALLFLLNPEPETLQAMRVRIPHLGARVYFVAAMLVGFRAGLTHLSKSFKSNREQFLAVPAFVHALLVGQGMPLFFRQEWDGLTGERRQELLWNGSVIAQVRLPAEQRVAMIAESVRAAGLEVFFSTEDGLPETRASAEGPTACIAFMPSSAPTFPRVRACEVSLRERVRASKRAAQAFVNGVNETSRRDGVYATLEEEGRGRAIRLVAFAAEPLSPAAVVKVVSALQDRFAAIAGP